MSTVLYGLLREEKERNLEMQEIHQREIASLPKGADVAQNVSGKKYYYLRRRIGNKVVAEYLGNDEAVIQEVQKKVAKRKHLESIVKRLKLEYKQICKIVKE